MSVTLFTSSVYANQPSKYKVVDPIGSIKSKCCIDIVVRHVSPNLQNVNVSDKFRVDIVEFGHKEVGCDELEMRYFVTT